MNLVRFFIIVSLFSMMTGCEPSRSSRQKSSNNNGDQFKDQNNGGGGNNLSATGWESCGVTAQTGEVGPNSSAQGLEIKNFCRNKDNKNKFRFTITQGNTDTTKRICVFPSYNQSTNGVPGAMSHYIGAPTCFNNGPNEEKEITFSIFSGYSMANELVFVTEGANLNAYVNCMDAIPGFMSGSSQAHLSVCSDSSFENTPAVHSILVNNCGMNCNTVSQCASACRNVSQGVCHSYSQSACCTNMAEQVRTFACNYFRTAHKRIILDFRSSP